ncbi:oxidoreductase domain-containing protein [Xylariaceae sp. FL0255]|nr:oxidoreductase domain-containing protein [Xylariaceae sp. FL0255]
MFGKILQQGKDALRPTPAPKKRTMEPQKVIYRSNDVAIPDDYLRADPADAKPITHTAIDFENSVLPEYKGLYAVVLDNVLSPSECAQLIQLAEDSVMDEDKEDGSSWRPALVNVGAGYEVEIPNYRKSERIIWDHQDIVDRLWARLSAVPDIRDSLTTLPKSANPGSIDENDAQDFYCINKRLRFLKYTSGEFFKPHCDGPYGEENAEGNWVQTYLTVHLYLNDSQQEVGPSSDLVGGATSFLSRDETRKIDVDPKAGRVLIFQHSRLFHSGAEVHAGTKYTVRTDIMYKLRRPRKLNDYL